MSDDLLSPDEINALLASGGDFGDMDEVSDADAEQLAKVSDTFANSENSVINMLAGKNVTTNTGSPEVLTQDEFSGKFPEIPFLFSTTFGGMDDMPLAIVVEQRGALTLADFMMGGTGNPVPEPNDMYWGASQEGLSQIVGSAFTSLAGMLAGRRLMPENTTSAVGEEGWHAFALEPADKKIWASPVSVTIEGLEPFNMWTCLTLDDALTIAGYMRDAIEGKKPEPQSSGGGGGNNSIGGGRSNVGPAVDVRPAAFQPLGGGSAGGESSPIDLIADIPVRVTVELGKARKSVSEILALNTGAVIELDKMAGEPVDILVNGKLIAHGEVVVIDENFGVRITDIISGGK